MFKLTAGRTSNFTVCLRRFEILTGMIVVVIVVVVVVSGAVKWLNPRCKYLWKLIFFKEPRNSRSFLPLGVQLSFRKILTPVVIPSHTNLFHTSHTSPVISSKI
jgi:hypothetical protein